MKEAVFYTGTFDPFHLGHAWQLERTYRAHPFDKAIIAVITANPKKPHATSWQNRVKLIELMLATRNLPFTVEIQPIDYVRPDTLKKFAATHLNGFRITRTVASDVIVEFAEDQAFGLDKALLLFNYAVVVRPLVGKEEVDQAVASLPPHIAKDFSYEIVHVQTEDDISGTEIRKDPLAAQKKGYITSEQLAFIQKEGLFSR